jgi:hypothetical protein
MLDFEYQIPDWHGADEWRQIKAHDAENAAELVGERYDCDGNYLLSRDENHTVKVLIRDAAGAVTRWQVGASHHVTYSAQEARDGE